jgi:dTDP-4-amino-4,6-dideoxygalactose transaminase
MDQSVLYKPIPFNKAWQSGKELDYIKEALERGEICGNGHFTHRCQQFLEEQFNGSKVLLTTSCTAALEIAAMLINIKPGDEVILPSFTFVSTANAFVLRGARLKFIDIRPDTFNMDESLIEQSITKKTKAIIPVHYASIGCEMETIVNIAKNNHLSIIEDAAQALYATFDNKLLGSFGDLSTISFHETKNFVCGEGGALIINNEKWLERAEIIREKGTNRSQFFRGQVDKYSWVDVGSSFIPSDMLAAFLLAQLESADQINKLRNSIASLYRSRLEFLEKKGVFKLPLVPKRSRTNNHMFTLLFQEKSSRDNVLKVMNAVNIQATFHYVPLHTSPFAKKMGYYTQPLPITDQVSDCLLRLPMYTGLTEECVHRICDVIVNIFK